MDAAQPHLASKIICTERSLLPNHTQGCTFARRSRTEACPRCETGQCRAGFWGQSPLCPAGCIPLPTQAQPCPPRGQLGSAAAWLEPSLELGEHRKRNNQRPSERLIGDINPFSPCPQKPAPVRQHPRTRDAVLPCCLHRSRHSHWKEECGF